MWEFLRSMSQIYTYFGHIILNYCILFSSNLIHMQQEPKIIDFQSNIANLEWYTGRFVVQRLNLGWPGWQDPSSKTKILKEFLWYTHRFIADCWPNRLMYHQLFYTLELRFCSLSISKSILMSNSCVIVHCPHSMVLVSQP